MSNNSNSPSTSNAAAAASPATASNVASDLTLNSLTKEKLNIVLQVGIYIHMISTCGTHTAFDRERNNFKLQASKKMVKTSFLN
ncbi:hypothetical protein G6F42_025926 [Rhizopus arrhizus]|nr:hypothetical protein G6F42_025926 [Rhizopus arrhizus]